MAVNKSKRPFKSFSKGLWAPILIICLGFVFSMAFVVKTLKGYKQPRPLLIKPSSVDTPEEITRAIYKALFPLKKRSFGIKLEKIDNNKISFKVTQLLTKKFPPSKNEFKFNSYKVSILEPHDTRKTDCRNTALFNLKRKFKRTWKKKIYFTICKEEKQIFSLFYMVKVIKIGVVADELKGLLTLSRTGLFRSLG